ncbi:hypothetical protein C8R45DRAFT_931190 [Mycena sanguinolenta]|nr:hypothetical protein C8R45DRAFT_931190 [Mycena sanguinolenta]
MTSPQPTLGGNPPGFRIETSSDALPDANNAKRHKAKMNEKGHREARGHTGAIEGKPARAPTLCDDKSYAGERQICPATVSVPRRAQGDLGVWDIEGAMWSWVHDVSLGCQHRQGSVSVARAKGEGKAHFPRVLRLRDRRRRTKQAVKDTTPSALRFIARAICYCDVKFWWPADAKLSSRNTAEVWLANDLPTTTPGTNNYCWPQSLLPQINHYSNWTITFTYMASSMMCPPRVIAGAAFEYRTHAALDKCPVISESNCFLSEKYKM